MNPETRLTILSAALDLKRVTTGYQSGAIKMSDTFSKEAIKWLSDIRDTNLPPYIIKILSTLPDKLSTPDKEARAEIALTYSIILQNYALAH